MSDDSKQALRDRIVAQVLKMNPELAKGKSKEEFSRDLVNSAKAVKSSGAGTDPVQTRFAMVFGQMLEEFTTELEESLAKLEDERHEVNQKVSAVHRQYEEQILEFLLATVGNSLSEELRQVLRKHADFLRELDINIAHITRRLKEKAPEG